MKGCKFEGLKEIEKEKGEEKLSGGRGGKGERERRREGWRRKQGGKSHLVVLV